MIIYRKTNGELTEKMSADKLNKNMNSTIYTPGTKFKVCTHKELVKKGWQLRISWLGKAALYEHDDFKKGGVITYSMIEDNQGLTLTIIGKSINFLNWYYVKENPNLWPVATFLETDIINTLSCDSCVEGVTPIDGWFICKTCGNNLRKIK